MEKQEKTAKRTTFHEIRRDMNVSIYRPKKDKCETCLGHEMGHISDTIFQHHQKMKTEARDAKNFDKEHGKFVYTMDVEAVLLCPKSNASSMYYKTKFDVLKFIYPAVTLVQHALQDRKILCGKIFGSYFFSKVPALELLQNYQTFFKTW